ncbi:ATP-grasp domain-containing protein [Saccharibacillus sacchari]|uniref:ATP-grasp domain-containing protein n=1 Tax=Saccharibacillus sacchari TaxID=456493 RepID=UPI001FE0AEF7|nr:ATP-grasp domain-containing protein [Saccharibacillus sacchari]
MNRVGKFAGKVVREYADFIGLLEEGTDIAIWCSEPVDFVTEWRCFIRYGEILDIRLYKGAWDSKLDLNIIRSAVRDFTDAPAAYGLDFGIDTQGNMKLVEINDAHSLGTYGIAPVNYAKFLAVITLSTLKVSLRSSETHLKRACFRRA